MIITVWKKGAGKINYPESAATTRVVGAMIARIMDFMVNTAGVRYQNLWCVGHSLGSHVCGHAGMRTQQKIGRVTG